MPMITTIDANLVAALTAAGIGVTTTPAQVPAYNATLNKRVIMASGVGVNQADTVYSGTRTVVASGTDALDLAAGNLVSPLGGTLTFVKLKAVLVRAAAANTNNVRVNRPASNGVPLFVAASGAVDVAPGGLFLWVAQGQGVAVTPGTGDLINCDNSGAGSSVTYDVVLVGTSA